MAKVKVGKKSAGSNKRNLIILGVLGGLIVVVGVVVFLVTKTESKPITPAGSPADAQVDRDQPVSTDRPSRPRASSVKRNSAPSEAPATEVTKDIPVPVVPAEMKALTGTVGEYFSRYERAVAGGESWSALSQWAEQAGLYVEAYHCARLAGSTMGLLARSPKTHATNVLVTDEQDRWKLVSQDTFEETLAVKPKLPSWFDPQQLVHQLGQLGPEQGSANQSRVASLLVQVDCPAGRKLYTQMINQPNFYPILVRATSHSYFDGDPNERQWARSWYQTPPMNLWLIRQLIAYSPPEQTKEKKETLVAGPEGLNRPNDKERQLSPALAHKLLLLQILARRGGIVSAALIGELLDADEKDDVGRGLVSGSVPIELFSRFAGSYAEPLVEPMGKILSQHSSNANEWGPVSQVMGRFFHDQAASVVFTLAEQKRMPIGGQTALSLAAGGGRYVLTRLLQLAHAGKLTDFDVVSVFLLWTKSENVEGKTFWDWMGSFVSPAALDQNGRGADDTAPGRRGIETPRFEDMPGEPEHATGRRVRHRQQRAEAPAARSGWPAQRRFTGLVDSNAAKEFLVGLAGLPAPKMTSEPKSRAPARPSPARRGPPVQRDNDASGTALQDNRQLKEDAVRVMATLGDTGLRQFYRTLIGDPYAGPFAQLALCIVNDSESCADLTKQFWHGTRKQPFGFGSAISNEKEKETVQVFPGKLSVPLDESGLPRYGITARQAIIYFNYSQAGEAFLDALGSLVTNKQPFDSPDAVVTGVCETIEVVGAWSITGSTVTLANLIESTGDFGLRGGERRVVGGQDSSPRATVIRRKALEVLGQIGDRQSIDVILRLAMYGEDDPELFVAARVALAKRGVPEALPLFLDVLEAPIAEQQTGSSPRGRKSARKIQTAERTISQIDPSLKTMTDVALLAIGRTQMRDQEVSRALELLRNASSTAPGRRPSGTSDLQSRLLLKLLENGHPELLRRVARLIGTQPISVGRDKMPDPYYWNRSAEKAMDTDFLEMIRALGDRRQFEDTQALLAFVRAIISREEQTLVPGHNVLSKWKLADHLMTFSERSGFDRESRGVDRTRVPQNRLGDLLPGLPGPAALHRLRPAEVPPTVGGAPQLPSKKELFLPLKGMDQLQKAPQEAASAALSLVAELDNARECLNQLTDLPFYKGRVYLLLLRLGDSNAESQLTSYLTDPGPSQEVEYLRALSLAQLREDGGVELLGILGHATQNSADVTWRLYLGDSALVVVKRLWEDELTGGTRVLADAERMGQVFSAWENVARLTSDSRELAERLAIVLAACQSVPNAVGALDRLVRDFGRDAVPLSEQAVGLSVDVASGLNPSGTPALVSVYKNILTMTTRATAEQRSGRRATMSPAVQPTYVQIAPKVILTLGRMKIPESKRALEELARIRTDLLGHIAIMLYEKDKPSGRKFMSRIVSRSGRDDSRVEAATLIVEYLAIDPTAENLEIVAGGIVRGDPLVANAAIAGIEQHIGETAHGPTINSRDLTAFVRTVLVGLTGHQARDIRQKTKVVGRMIEIGRQFSGDEAIADAVERLERIKSRLEARK